jgi:AcrR family transcriptional regulator
MKSENNTEKPLTRTQLARRDDILAAAITVLDREGVTAASVDRIAKEARTSKGTVLYHFKTKEAIYQAVVEALFREGGAYMTERIMAVPSRPGKLREYLASNLRFIAEHREHVSAVHKIQDGYGTGDHPDAVSPLTQLLISGQTAGEFGVFDATMMALAIRAVVDGASYYYGAHPELDTEHSIREVIQLFEKATAPEGRL